jgi:plasmid maintenance system killer protein
MIFDCRLERAWKSIARGKRGLFLVGDPGFAPGFLGTWNFSLWNFALRCSLFWLQFPAMIKSFADSLTEKIFRGDNLTKKEARQLGDIRIDKAQERLLILHHSAEKDLLTLHSLHYHKLQGTGRYSIDANSRNSKWRITFAWADQALTDVSLVKIEDTH